jgi:hypothetical protein
MENYIQESEGASLIKHGLFIDVASHANLYLQNEFIYKIFVSDIFANYYQ